MGPDVKSIAEVQVGCVEAVASDEGCQHDGEEQEVKSDHCAEEHQPDQAGRREQSDEQGENPTFDDDEKGERSYDA